MSSLLSLGIQAVRANQTGLAVTGNNISNLNTPGYNRQIPGFQSVEGGGVKAEFSQRIVDSFVNGRIWADNSSFQSARIFEQFVTQLQDVIASPSTSIAVKLDDYFSALQLVNDDPTSLTNRELFIAELDDTVRRFNNLHNQLMSQADTINERINEVTNEVNTIALRIADLNERIVIATAGKNDAFELLDQRDQAIKELAGLIDIKTIEERNTSQVTVFIGNGQPLIVGNNASQLVARQNTYNPEVLEVGIVIANRINSLPGLINGGELGGLLDYRNRALNQAMDDLGRLALTLADTMNEQHYLGMDLDGKMGVGLFEDINSLKLTRNRMLSNNFVGDVRITDTKSLQSSEYELIFLSEDTFRLTRLSDGREWTQDSFVNQVDPQDVEQAGQMYFAPFFGELRLEIDGFRLNINNLDQFKMNDRALIQPVRSGAGDLASQIADGRQLAVASPLTVAPGSNNQGTGRAHVFVTELSEPFSADPRVALSGLLDGDQNPLEIRRLGPGVYEVVGRSDLVATVNPNNSKQIIIDKVDGTEGKLMLEINGVPANGDVFLINYNFQNEPPPSDKVINIGVSDNRNGLFLSDLMKTVTTSEGNYQQSYSRMIERVGITTRIAQTNREASEAVLRSSEAQRDSISGVNLDEEAIRLVQFQQAYQAAAQLITASQRTFDALINAI